ncbi:endospore germination permease [Paenibacillus sp. MWE-103]|uniref:Endospore germination permease n=1 Tax=Paenibacillus artemisiicola TaxID=1172618 RepID=A0ABS3WFE2_9BACL|nr:endospore germination permease [Paenibacillus artemisiicola]MBO7746831.1 endospore germination permease [Paenibacillus artemisiicola]
MIEQGKINARQLAILTLLFSLGSSILIVPSGLTAVAKQDGWLSAIVGVGVGVLLIGLYVTLSKRYPGQTLVQFAEQILGTWLGKLVGLLFFSFYFLLASLVLRNVGDFITTIVMPETPIQIVHLLFIMAILMSASLGLEVIARTAEIFLPWIMTMLLLLIVFLLPQIQFDRIQPVFEAGAKAIINGSLSVISIPYLELTVFLMIIPSVNKTKIGMPFLKGAVLGGLVIIVITLLCVFVLGWDFASRHTFPSYTLAKKIQVGEFLQRIEVLVAIIWFLTIFFKLSLCFYAALLGFAQVLRLQSYRPMIVPFGILIGVLSIIVYPNIVYFRVFAGEIWPFYSATFGLFLPLLLLVVSWFRPLAAGAAGGGSGSGGSQPGGGQSGGNQPSESPSGGSQQSDSQAGGNQSNQGQAGGNQPSGSPSGGSQQSDSQAGGNPSGQGQAGGNQPSGSPSGGSQQSDNQSGGNQSGQGQSGGNQPSGSPSGGSQQSDNQAGRNPLGGGQSGGNRPDESQANVNQQSESPSGNNPSVGSQPGGGNTGGASASKSPSGEGQSGGNPSGGNKSG